MKCKCCGNWFSSSNEKSELCITCDRAMSQLRLSGISYDRLKKLVEEDMEQEDE